MHFSAPKSWNPFQRDFVIFEKNWKILIKILFFCLNDKEVRTTLDFVNEFKCDKMFVRYPGTPDTIVHMIDADVFTDEFGRVMC